MHCKNTWRNCQLRCFILQFPRCKPNREPTPCYVILVVSEIYMLRKESIRTSDAGHDPSSEHLWIYEQCVM